MILHGDCLEQMQSVENDSVDSIVTDPPYGISFMGKKWDYDVPKVEVWKEALRVLKPGGHILVACGTRTQHRMCVNIEDAGFEIRDIVAWVYGSGFPKSLNIGKAVDKICGETGRKEKFTQWMRTTGITASEINSITKTFMGSHYLTAKEQPAIPTAKLWEKLRPHIKIGIPKWVDELVERIEREREVIGKRRQRANSEKSNIKMNASISSVEIVTKGNSKYEGWGTALKPAMELWTLARKPLSEKTVAENVLKWGTGGINIDECRVEATKEDMGDWDRFKGHQNNNTIRKNMVDNKTKNFKERVDNGVNNQGRFPANLIHDGSDEVVGLFPDTKSGSSGKGSSTKVGGMFGSGNPVTSEFRPADSGSASRFFYCAKASKSERNAGLEGFEEKEKPDNYIMPKLTCSECGSKRVDSSNKLVCGCNGKTHYEQQNSKDSPNNLAGGNKNHHPTVKPIKLMQYLTRLITPKGGTVLDPYMGSGTTGIACKKEGFEFIGVELDEDYFKIAKARIEKLEHQHELF